jgi:hypothetical protein
MFKDLDPRNAHIALLVSIVVMAIGTAIFGGRNASDLEEQVIVWSSLVAAFATFLMLEHSPGRSRRHRGRPRR